MANNYNEPEPYFNDSNENNSDNTGLKIAAAVGGIALAGTVGALAGNAYAESNMPEVTEPEPDTITEETTAVSTIGNNIPFMHVDTATFDEAFATARAELGPGAAFEWHGQTYGTYYATEWNAMSADQRDDWQHDVLGSAHNHHHHHHHHDASAHDTNQFPDDYLSQIHGENHANQAVDVIAKSWGEPDLGEDGIFYDESAADHYNDFADNDISDIDNDFLTDDAVFDV